MVYVDANYSDYFKSTFKTNKTVSRSNSEFHTVGAATGKARDATEVNTRGH